VNTLLDYNAQRAAGILKEVGAGDERIRIAHHTFTTDVTNPQEGTVLDVALLTTTLPDRLMTTMLTGIIEQTNRQLEALKSDIRVPEFSALLAPRLMLRFGLIKS
jgi:hypothetical protein